MASVVSKPSVSIVVAAASAADVLPAALAAVASQDYEGQIEVVVAAADTDTAAAATGSDTKVVPNPAGTTPAGLNLAVGASTGEVVVRVDAQSQIPPHYVTRMVETLASTGADVVGGMQVPTGTTFLQRAIAASMTSRFGAGDARYRVGGPPGPTDTVYLGALRRPTFDEIGGYDERFLRNQDYELNHRIRTSGGTVWLDPEVEVGYRPRSSLRALASQYFQYGRWKRFFLSVNPGSLRLRQWAPPLLVLVLLAALVASVFTTWAWMVPAAYILALILIGAAHLPSVGTPALAMPLTLAVMHIWWGAGFLIGISRQPQNNDR